MLAAAVAATPLDNAALHVLPIQPARPSAATRITHAGDQEEALRQRPLARPAQPDNAEISSNRFS